MFQSSIASTPFTSNMTYEILLIVVIGGIGSVTGSIIGAFLFVACSEWWLRGLDSGTFLGISAAFMRPGFRKVVFAVIIMCIVLFYSRGIMGTKEFTWEGFLGFFKRLFTGQALKEKKEKKNKSSENNHNTNTDNEKEAQ